MWQPAEYVREVPGLVVRGDHDADPGTGPADCHPLEAEAGDVRGHGGLLSLVRSARFRLCSPPGYGDQDRPEGPRVPRVMWKVARNADVRLAVLAVPRPRTWYPTRSRW